MKQISSKPRVLKCWCRKKGSEGVFSVSITAGHTQKPLTLVWHAEATTGGSSHARNCPGSQSIPFSARLWRRLSLANPKFSLISFHVEKLQQTCNNPYIKLYGISVVLVVTLTYHLIILPQLTLLLSLLPTGQPRSRKWHRPGHASTHPSTNSLSLLFG